MGLDFAYAEEVFERYLDRYDRSDDKIKLKIVHTRGVVKCAGEIAGRMGLSGEDRELAKMIGLLHDIGRFEQVRRFDSFQPDTMDHAAFGVELLFGKERMIRQFVPDETYDPVIRQAILLHSDFVLPEITDQRTLLHARLIRDADKLDNCRVKLVDSVEAMIGVNEKEAGKGKISPKVWASCKRRESVLSADRKTAVDYWVSYIAQYFDVNFGETYSIIKERDYISRIGKRLYYEDPDTRAKIQELTEDMTEYMEKRMKETCEEKAFGKRRKL